MNPAFERFARDPRGSLIPCVFPVLLAAAAGRQAASPTLRLHARAVRIADARRLLSPAHGSFNAEVARALRRWQRQ
ncbi:hypothetical protein [Sphingomonas sp.]